LQKQLIPIEAYGQPIGLIYDSTLAGYLVANSGAQYYLSPTEVVETSRFGEASQPEPASTYWLKGKLITRDLFSVTDPTSDVIAHHVRITGSIRYLLTDLVPVGGTRLKFEVNDYEGDNAFDIYFATDMTPLNLVAFVKAYVEAIDKTYRNVFQFDTDKRAFFVTTQTPIGNPVSPIGCKIRVLSGTANTFLGFINNDYAIGDVPKEYNNSKHFLLLQKKTTSSDKYLSDYFPVVEENRILTHCMAQVDADAINANKKMRLFWDGLAYGMDVAEREIDRILDAFDADKIEVDFLQQIAKTIGFDLPILGPVTDDAKRDFVKNLIHIYQIKGTPLSVETVFRFLSFTSVLTERTSDASANYPPIILTIQQSDIDQYYQTFLQTTEPNDFFDQFNWFYVDLQDIEKRITAAQHYRLPIVQGLNWKVQDPTNIEITQEELITGLLGPFDISQDYGRLKLTTAAVPDFVIDEILYASGKIIGTVTKVIDSFNYEVEYADGAYQDLPFGHVSGTKGGGGVINGLIFKHLPNNKISLYVDNRYTFNIDFNNYDQVYVNGNRYATSAEVETAIQIAALEQGIKLKVRHIGDTVAISSTMYGDKAQIEIINGNYSLGFNDGDKTTLQNQVKWLEIGPGTVNIPTDNGNRITSYFQANVQVQLHPHNTKFIYVHLINRYDPYSTIILTNEESLDKERLAQILAIEWIDDHNIRITPKRAQDEYRTPFLADLTDSQNNQLTTFLRYKTTELRYWTAAGRPTAGDYTNQNRYEERHPWVAPDMTLDPGLGNSIFAKLSFTPFTPKTFTAEDLTRLIWFVEFLRPVHVVFELVLNVLEENEKIIGLPYDPLTYGFNTKFPTFYGNYPMYYWAEDIGGPAIEEEWILPWLGYNNTIHRLWPTNGVFPIGADLFMVGDVIEFRYIQINSAQHPNPPFVLGDVLTATPGGATGVYADLIDGDWYVLYSVNEALGATWQGDVTRAGPPMVSPAHFKTPITGKVNGEVVEVSPGAGGVGYIDITCTDNNWAISRTGAFFNANTLVASLYSAATNISVRMERSGLNAAAIAGANQFVDKDGIPLLNPPWGMPGVDAFPKDSANVPNRLAMLNHSDDWTKRDITLPIVAVDGAFGWLEVEQTALLLIMGSVPLPPQVGDLASAMLAFDVHGTASVKFIQDGGAGIQAFAPNWRITYSAPLTANPTVGENITIKRVGRNLNLQDGRDPAIDALTLRDLAQRSMYWELSPEGSLNLALSKSAVAPATTVFGAFVYSGANARLEYHFGNFTPFKQPSHPDTAVNHEDHWPVSTVEITDTEGGRFWAYGRWAGPTYNPESVQYLYAYKDMRGRVTGWNQVTTTVGYISIATDFPFAGTVNSGDVYYVLENVVDNDPLRTNTLTAWTAGDKIVWNNSTWVLYGTSAPMSIDVQNFKIYRNAPWSPGLADLCLTDLTMTEDEDAASVVQDVFHTLYDGTFSGLAACGSQDNLNSTDGTWANRFSMGVPQGGGFWANRSFGQGRIGYDSKGDPILYPTRGGVWPIFDADALISVKVEADIAGSLGGPFAILHNLATGVISGFPALALANIRPGMFLDSDPGVIPGSGDEKFHTILGVDDAAHEVLIRPNTTIGAGLTCTLRDAFPTNQLLYPIRYDILAAAYYLGPIGKTYEELTPTDIMTMAAANFVFYIQGDTEIQTGYFQPMPVGLPLFWGPFVSVYDNYSRGIFYQGAL
jgi:hypothetical protein